MKKYLISTFTAALMVFSLNLVVSNNQQANANTNNQCPAVMQFLRPAAGAVLSGVVPIEISGTADIEKITVKIDDEVLGRARPDPSSGNQWVMPWDTRFTESETGIELTATVKLGGGGECEIVSPVEFDVDSPDYQPLDAFLTPQDWVGPTNTVALFDVQFNGPSSVAELHEHAVILWHVSGRGFVTPQQNGVGRYYSGPSEGDGEVKAIVRYGGQEVVARADVDVFPQNGGGNTGNNGDDDNDDDSENDPFDDDENDDEPEPADEPDTDSSGDVFRPKPVEPKEAIKRIVENDEAVEECLDNKLGDGQLSGLIEANRRPTRDEFLKYLGCFSRQNYVLPSILAPVAPEEVREKKESAKVRVAQIKNDFKQQEDGSDKQVLVLSGQSDPFANILLYVYSEPLVLATVADENGDWSYSLEDPLNSGEHEVYALVDKGDGEYERSSVASFIIGEAEASEANPNGYSLNLLVEPTVSASNRSINIFIAAAVGVVAFTAVVIASFAVQKKVFRTKPAEGPSIDGGDDNNVQPPDNFYTNV